MANRKKATSKEVTTKPVDIINEAGIKVKCNLTYESSVKTLALKIYDEQIADDWEHLQERIKQLERKYLCNSIMHDNDYSKNDIYNPEKEKNHYHILVNCGKTPVKVRTILKKLGVNFRPGEDDNLFKKDGCTTIGNWAAYNLYLLHGTKQAIKDGKTPYSMDKLVSNMSMSELQTLIGGEKHRINGVKLTDEDYAELDEEAYETGYSLKDYDEWYHSLPFTTRRNSSMREIEKSYNYGLDKRLSEQESINVNKLCVYIQGEANIGKSYATRYALKGKKVLDVSGGKTGKFDSLNPSYNAIVVDDDTDSRILQLCDNRYCKMYRRNSTNKLFCGDCVVVTSNKSFEEWYSQCGYDKNDKDTYEAVKSRFYVCRVGMSCKSVGKRVLKVDSPSNRGTRDEQLFRKKRFLEFRRLFEESLNSYVPVDNEVDYNDLDEAYLNSEDEYKEACDIVKASELVCNNESVPDELKSVGAELKRMRDRVKLSVYDEYIAHIKTSILFYEQKFEGDMSISEYVELDKNNPFKDEDTVA